MKVTLLSIIHDNTLKKGFWKLGLMKLLIRGRDQEVHGVEVKISSKGLSLV